MTRYLVLLETASNQKYIFATNKLRENVGASELTFRAAKSWVWGAVHPKVTDESRWNEADPAVNPPIGPSEPVQIILATSGKAYLLAESVEAAKEVVRKVTTKALTHAPGIDLSGIYVKIDGDDFDEAIKTARKKLAERRCTNPGTESRFRRLPVVAECATSGLPAATYEDSKREPGPRSAQSRAKRQTSGDGIKRMRDIARDYTKDQQYPNGLGIVYSVADLDPNLDQLDDVAKRRWLAVVHADGNGLGKVFQNFAERAKETSLDYVAALQTFSRALDECTYRAFGFALKQLAERTPADPLPVVPIVLGGDDMTVVMDGKYAVQFAIDFLAAFEKFTGDDKTITKIVGGKVTACAGVAVVKPHFPFYAAYELAEELIKSAKKFAKGTDEAKPLSRSALDFHILYDASGADLTRIRKEMEPDAVTNLVARPYLVGSDLRNPLRTTDKLNTLMGVIRGKNEDGRRAIPNSQLHDLREALFLGRTAAEARLGLVFSRYEKVLKPLLTGDKLFWEAETGKDGTVHRTHLLDAIDLVEFWSEDDK